MDGMREQLHKDLVAALKRRDPVAVPALRSLLSALANAEAVDGTPLTSSTTSGSPHVAGAVAGLGATEVERRLLSSSDMAGIIRAEVSERVDVAGRIDARTHGRRVQQLLSEAQVLSGYLPGDA